VNVNLGIWDKLTKLIVLLLLLSALLGIALWYFPLIRHNERLRKEILALEAEIRKEEEDQKRLKTSIDALSDPRTVERLAREKLSYAKPGETIIRFESPATNSAPSKP
jgi:cell division protein FtsL